MGLDSTLSSYSQSRSEKKGGNLGLPDNRLVLADLDLWGHLTLGQNGPSQFCSFMSSCMLEVGVVDGQDTVKSHAKSVTRKKSEKKVTSPTKTVNSSGSKPAKSSTDSKSAKSSADSKIQALDQKW